VTLRCENHSYEGFITDLSQAGILLCMHKSVENIGDFSMELPIADSDDGKTFEISAKQVRMDTISNIQYNEIGCQFSNVSDSQEKHINELMGLMEKDEDQESGD